MVDTYLWGKVSRISPEAPIPIVEVLRESSMPGGAANVAQTLLAMGAKVLVAGVVGDDQDGRTLVRLISEMGGDASTIVTDPSRSTTIKTRVLAQHQQIVRIDRELTTALSSAVSQDLLMKVAAILPRVDGVILSDYSKGVLQPSFCKEIIALCQGKIITVDPKPHNIQNFAGASLITPNMREAELAVGFPLRTNADVEKAALKLRDDLSLGAVLITRGEEGMTLLSGDHFMHLPTKARQVFDVTGAGDTVIGVATLALCSGASHEDAAHLANVAAGITVAHVGVYAVKPHELLDSLQLMV
jgi:D-beta-D-heptose 7-phosphate kinase/D-beta-D-heptose 1-phosphate adenosyltransferase